MQVQTTKDYGLFSSLVGNREINYAHKEKLKKSIKENYLMTVLVVNEKHEIIDGQHRFQAIKELELPIHYVVMRGYGLKEVQKLNVNSKNWTANDYMDSYIELGYEDYRIFKEFQEKYGFYINESITILLNASNIGGNYFSDFQQGKFKVRDYSKAVETAEKIKGLEKYYPEYNRRAFVAAMLLLLNLNVFDYSKFIHKLKLQETALKKCQSRQQYVEIIETIYNYREREKTRLY